jgi:hypothetical protein
MRALWCFATALGIVAVALSFVHTPSAPETSCARIIHNYLHQAAQAAGYNLTNEHLIACHHDAGTAVARVEFDAKQTGFPAQHETLSLRLVKAAWWPADVHVVG